MGNRIVRNLPDGKYKAAVGNVLADGENPFSTESEVKEEVTATEVVNGLIEGITGSSNDAATQTLGSAWRMPTLDEWTELVTTCTMTWTTIGATTGYLVEHNGNSIFLPAAGYRKSSTYDLNVEGNYWLGSRDPGGDELARFAAFNSSTQNNNGFWLRYYGRSIRAVSDTEGVDLGLSVKWASTNLGGTNPEDYGEYFAWGEIETKTDFTYDNYICPRGSYETENDPITHITRPAIFTILHKDNHNSHVTVEQKEEWTGKQDHLSQAQIDATNSGITSGKVETYDGYATGKQDVLGFTPENVANKITDMSNPQAGEYADALTVKNFVASALVGINDYVSSLSTMTTAFEGCSAMSYAPTKLEAGPWYKNGISETANIDKGDWAIVLADETVCWFSANDFKYERFKDGGASPLGYVILSGGTAVAGTKGTNPCIEIGGDGVVLSYIYPEVVGENTYICFLDNSGAEAITWKVQSLSNVTGAVHKYIGGIEQEDVYDIVFPTTRYICSGHDENNNPVWSLLFVVNETSLTAAQWDAINSAITKAWKNQVDGNLVTLNSNVSEHIANTELHVTLEKQNTWNAKQNALAAGINIDTASFATGTINVTGVLQASQNLADVANKQTALDNLASASKAKEGQILMVNPSKNLTYVDRYEITSGVVTNEVSAHDLRDDGFAKPYIPIMSFLLRNSEEKFEVEFTIMTCDNIGGVSTYNSRYFFVHTIQGIESTSFECLNYFGSSSDISYKDVVYTLNDNVLTFYKKKSTQYDWFLNVINYVSKIGLATGYATPTFYIGSRAVSVKDYEVRVQESDFKDASEISNMVLPRYLQEPYIVDISEDSDGWSSDKTFIEVQQALTNGKIVYYKLTIDTETGYLPVSLFTNSFLIAESSDNDNTATLQIKHTSDDVITIVAKSFQERLVVGTNLDSMPASGSNNPITSGGVYTLNTDLIKGIKRENSASVELTPNIFRVFSSSLSTFTPTCINYDSNYECQYKGRFTASANFIAAGTGHDSGNITWVGDSNCITGGVYEYNIVDNYGLIKKMNN